MSIQSNAQEIFARNLRTIEELKNGDKILRAAALNTVAAISFRVQQQGQNTDGEVMHTSSSKTFKAYSYYYGKKRDRLGFQTDHIDLTVTGALMDGLSVMPDGTGGYVVGFTSETSSQKAEYNEERFGTIFHLSTKEADTIFGEVINEVNAIIRRNS